MIPLDPALAALCCPHCAEPLAPDPVGGRLTGLDCLNGHHFDAARQGYVSLLASRSRTDTGDSADMVSARSDFLGAGHYLPIAVAVAAVVRQWIDHIAPDSSPVMLEIGGGTAYYLARTLADVPSAAGISLDSSKFAARHAAAVPGVLSVVADAWSPLPVRTATVNAVLSIFAPRQAVEVRRVLAAGGIFVAVTPEPAHLVEIRDRLGMLKIDEGKPAALAQAFDGLLHPVDQRTLTYPMLLNRDQVQQLIRMGPSARHIDRELLPSMTAQLADRTSVTVSVTISAFVQPASEDAFGQRASSD